VFAPDQPVSHLTYLGLYALGKPAAEPINGRPVWMGTNLGYINTRGLAVWKEHVVRELGGSDPLRQGGFVFYGS